MTPTATDKGAAAAGAAGTGIAPGSLPELPTASLSPSRAGDFMTCPLLYRFRNIDRLPEPPSVEAYRGTLVHAVLERLFDLPAAERTPERADGMLAPEWESLLADEPQLTELLFGPDDNWLRAQQGQELGSAGPQEVAEFLAEASRRLATYFQLEDPRRLEPASRELYVEAQVAGGLTLRGFIDRLDRAPDGRTRVVDYKTGRAPRELFEQKALFQLKCYALALWRSEGRIPTVLQLLYLGDGQVLRYEPDEADLRATERKLGALWAAVQRAYATGDWRANRSRLCDWCSHQSRCPEWGGTPPPLPGAAATG